MGRNAGGVMMAVTDSGVVVRKGATEEGYTKKMLKNIVGVEQKIRTNKDETLYAFSSDGDLRLTIGGKGATVKGDPNRVPADSILTHNHPRSIGQKGVLRIGNSFSETDLVTMVTRNAKEMRAVTPTYTFSLKRPNGGWGTTEAALKKAYRKAKQETYDYFDSYFAKVGKTHTSVARANAIFFHKLNGKLAKQFGWDYTRKKG